MRTQDISHSEQRAQLVERLRQLTPLSSRQWGRMTPHQAVCHLADAFRAMMRDTPVKSIGNPFSRTVIKWIALNAPMKWPPGVKTVPEVDQEIGGTKPIEFLRDRQDLERLMDEFATRTGDFQPHPIFGPLTRAEWHRWAWRHMDHHLRQFGV